MFIVAFLLLPVVAVLLYGMDRIEDWLIRAPRSARPAHARPRHLRLIHGGKEAPADRTQTGRQESDAA